MGFCLSLCGFGLFFLSDYNDWRLGRKGLKLCFPPVSYTHLDVYKRQTADCDADALVVEVVKDGPACHTGAESCFFQPVYLSPELKAFSYEGLYRLIQGRKTEPKEGSYTSYLFEKGLDKILKKVGEECTEVIIGGRKEDKAETIYEIADLTYHVMVLMVQMGISVQDITAELEKRHVVDLSLIHI